jgi:hypothetical protein
VALVLVGAAGGWLFGRGLGERAEPAAVEIPVAPRRGAATVTPESAQGIWMAKVKVAGATDFPALMEEWERLFADADEFEGPPEDALRWILGEWVVKDPDGFFRVASDDSGFSYQDTAGEVLAMLLPEEAAKRLLGSVPLGGLGVCFIDALAEHRPGLYFAHFPDGSIDGNDFVSDKWLKAVSAFARVDPLAAGNVCLRCVQRGGDPQLQCGAMVAVAAAWRGGKPTLAEWVAGIENPQLRNLAAHARLQALAQQDPQAAAKELFAMKLEDYGDGPGAVLAELAKVDLPKALRLLQKAEADSAGSDITEGDPFAEKTPESLAAEAAAKGKALAANPFAHPNPVSIEVLVVSAATKSLPDDPAKFLEELGKLRATMGDSDWQRKIEGQMIAYKASRWSAEECLAVAKLWTSSPGEDGGAIGALAYRAVSDDPGKVAAQIESLPAPARGVFARRALQELPREASPDPKLISLLGAADWTFMGGQLALHADAYAPVIAVLPPETTVGARADFMETWARLDPQAAAQWLGSLLANSALAVSAKDLARGWAAYDNEAAAAWASELPAGPAFEGAASGMVDGLLRFFPADAFAWAMKIKDPAQRVDALSKLRSVPDGRAPDGVAAALAEARRAAGLAP